MKKVVNSFKRGRVKYRQILKRIKTNTMPISSFGKKAGIDQQLLEAYAAGTPEFRVFYMVREPRPDGGGALVLRAEKFKKIEVAG